MTKPPFDESPNEFLSYESIEIQYELPSDRTRYTMLAREKLYSFLGAWFILILQDIVVLNARVHFCRDERGSHEKEKVLKKRFLNS